MDSPAILICYDGSDGAVKALSAAAKLFPGARATIAFAWKPPLPYGGISYGGQIILPPEIQQEIAQKAREEAERLVGAAVERARSEGLDATTDVRESKVPIWRQLLAAADDIDADVIVAGSRGYGEVKALLLGSTSQALAHHSRRPLLIVPAPAGS
jgi:nucleotide-binding universal stress UspA family protein